MYLRVSIQNVISLQFLTQVPLNYQLTFLKDFRQRGAKAAV